MWKFGTAGIRGQMGPGENQLNAESVTRIIYGIGRTLKASSRVAIGYDARHHSAEFASICAEVLRAQGHEVFLFGQMIPTPLCAFAVCEMQADAGIMVTASHNPPRDNGIKVYGSNGAQWVAPMTSEAEQHIAQAPDQIARDVTGIKQVPESVIDAYFPLPLWERVRERGFPIIYTPMHGVGAPFATRALRDAGFEDIRVVPSQAEPDGDFPTVQFPNPEEPGALDEALQYAKAQDADLILANDPDADRLAVCVDGKILTGNQIGVLLGNYLLENYSDVIPAKAGIQPLVMTTFVSSRMLSKIAAYHGASYEETLTGFANIMLRASERERELGEQFLFGYEEALGYCVGRKVRDKDGISAAVVFAQLYAALHAQGKTIFDELERLAALHGLFVGHSWTHKLEGENVEGKRQEILGRLTNLPGLVKQKSAAGGLLTYQGEHDLRLIIRPSGTEPKIKFYAEVIGTPKQKSVLDNFLTQLEKQVRSSLLVLMCMLASIVANAADPNPIGSEGAFPAEVAEPEKESRFGFAGIPVVGYASGFGTGFGAVGSMYQKEPGVTPYKWEIDGQVYFTTGGMQSHRLRFDYLNVGGTSLRIRPMIGMLVLPGETYCGQGMRADCNPENPTPNYYNTRYWELFGIFEARWHLKPMPHRVDIITSWRGSWYQIGNFGDRGPYPGSLYQKDFGSDVGDGFASVLEAGVMVDNRDFEPAPHQGYWAEFTLRESSPYWGSNWSYIGANLSLRGYVPLIKSKRLVLAGQLIFDGMAGKAPLQEIVRVGGTGRYFNTFGGQEVGRGLREQYFPGRLKAYKQVELRWDMFDFNLWHWNIDVTSAAFVDLGLVAWDYSTLTEERFRPALGTGGGIRFLWDRAVVIRFDVGTSPIENYSPRFYFVIGNVF